MSPPLKTAFACSASAGTGVLDRSKALTQVFDTCDNTPVSAVIELVHELHGAQWVYNSSPLSEELEILGYLINPAGTGLQLQGVYTADLGTNHVKLMGKHWVGCAAAPSRGEQWVRAQTTAHQTGSITAT
jgi:hypothetical protein